MGGLNRRTRSTIHVKHRWVGYHCWRDAPDEVAFLRDTHRHVFHLTASIEVRHDDRELEFFLVQRVIRGALRDEIDHGGKSCETIALELISVLEAKYGADRLYAVTVSEDGENAATVETEI